LDKKQERATHVLVPWRYL